MKYKVTLNGRTYEVEVEAGKAMLLDEYEAVVPSAPAAAPAAVATNAQGVLMPKAGITVESCIIGEWLKKVGDQIKVGDVLFTYETDKASFECESTEEGELLAIFYEAGDEVPCLVNVCAIGTKGEDCSALRPGGAAAPVAEAPAPAAEQKKPEGRRDIFAELGLADDDDKVKILKAKGSKNVTTGIVHISSTFNNTVVSVTDLKGNVIGWSSAGKLNFKGSRKSTAYAGQVVCQDACRQAMGHGLKEVEVRVKGPGSGRESAVRAVQAIGLEISSIADVTPIPHNGCRPPKARRA